MRDTSESWSDEAAISTPCFTRLPGFKEADLAMNETGRLSAAQKDCLKRDVRVRVLWIVVAALLFGWVAGIVFGQAVIALIYVLAIVVLGLRTVPSRLADLRQGRVAAVQGQAYTLFVDGGEDEDQYWLHIDGLRLETNSDLHQLFVPGGPYRVFCAFNSQRVVAAKALPGWRHLDPRSDGR